MFFILFFILPFLCVALDGFYVPTSNGGSLLTTVPDTFPPGQAEPINMILSGNSDPDVLQDTPEGLLNYFLSLSFSGECLGQHRGNRQQADLGDGRGLVNETAVIRYDYGDPTLGTCKESQQGGNHFRYWVQNGSLADSGAVFMAVSYEKSQDEGHDIVPNGYNFGRDYIVGNISGSPIPTPSLRNSSTFSGSTSSNGYTYSSTITYLSGLLSNTSEGINHNLTVSTDNSNAVDGLIALVEVRITARPQNSTTDDNHNTHTEHDLAARLADILSDPSHPTPRSGNALAALMSERHGSTGSPGPEQISRSASTHSSTSTPLSELSMFEVLEYETQRGQEALARAEYAETQVKEILSRACDAEEARARAETQYMIERQESSRYREELERLQQELQLARDNVTTLTEERDAAQKTAQREKEERRKCQTAFRNYQAREEGREEGIKQGMARQFQQERARAWQTAYEEGYEKGQAEGFDDGKKLGYKQGFAKGREKGRKEERKNAMEAFDQFLTEEVRAERGSEEWVHRWAESVYYAQSDAEMVYSPRD
ncbi:hypothetical protein VKT23_000884 [Stygiomarasmius scandens]|uniref:Uncharacterized protein n=1 Tax=Marasmiellus scandens TaxID=2682957 RepID=A0ABR1K7B0_9AGAR